MDLLSHSITPLPGPFKVDVPQLAVLVDPEKEHTEEVLAAKVEQASLAGAGLFFVGGSTMPDGRVQEAVITLKKLTKTPVIVFPGSHNQVSMDADGLLFLTLISGRNPDFLIEQQIHGARILKGTSLPVIPTGYILLDGGKVSSTQMQSQTQPLSMNDEDLVVSTALAAKLMGMKVIYLDAGSGARHTVPPALLEAVKRETGLPLIVGGGIRDVSARDTAWGAGADIVVVGNALEEGRRLAANSDLRENQ